MHSPTCTGCPECSALARAILDNPTNPVLMTAMGNPRLRALAESALRDCCATDDVNDSYARDLQKLRAAQHIQLPSEDDVEARLRDMQAFRESYFEMATTSLRAASEPATSNIHLEPQDPYLPDLQRLRGER